MQKVPTQERVSSLLVLVPGRTWRCCAACNWRNGTMGAPHREGTVKESVETAKNHGLLRDRREIETDRDLTRARGGGAGGALAGDLGCRSVSMPYFYIWSTNVQQGRKSPFFSCFIFRKSRTLRYRYKTRYKTDLRYFNGNLDQSGAVFETDRQNSHRA